MYILITFFVCVIILAAITIYLSKTETFENQERMNTRVITKQKDIFDDFYAEIYDILFPTEIRVPFDAKDIETNALVPFKNDTFSRTPIKILDIGCGTGSHVNIFSKYNYETHGLDISYDMLQKAKQTHKIPKSRLTHGSAYQKQLYPQNSFTHITCLYFTIYYMKDIDAFLKNVKYWLPNGGYFVVHLVDRKMFDPILDKSSPFPGFSSQKYTNKRYTKSQLEFNNFSYTGEFKLKEKDNIAEYIETIYNKPKKYNRKQKHTLHMPCLKSMEKKIKSHMFSLVHVTHLISCEYEYQYLYYFKNIK